MDFGVMSLEGFVSDSLATVAKSHGSGFLKQERSGSDEDQWRSSKAARMDGSDFPKTMLNQQVGTSLLRSNSLLSGDEKNMLSFSSPKSDVTFLTKSGDFVGRSTQNPAFSHYQNTPQAYTRNAEYGSGGYNAVIQGPFPRIRGPFTPTQWLELEHQALIYKYIMSGVPVPSNLLIALKKSINPFGLAGSSSGSYVPNSLGWNSFHLGFAGNGDPEPGRCRRTDGKKWRCSKDAVPDQKYCEKHINRGRHRSRKHVEGQTGRAASGPTAVNVAPTAPIMSASVGSGGGASNSFSITHHQYKGLQSNISNSSTETHVNRMQDHKGLSLVSPTVSLKSKDSPFSIPKQHFSFEEASQSEFGFVSADSLLNPSQKSTYPSSKYSNSFIDFNDQEETHDQNPLRHFIDDWPKDQTHRDTITWPEELKSDWTQLSISIPMASSDFSSTSSSPPHDKLSMSPLRLSREFDPTQMGLQVGCDPSEPNKKQTNSIPISWGSSMGGPLGEVLKTGFSSMGASKNSLGLNRSPQYGSSPTGVLQKTTFVSLSNGSTGSSPRTGNKRTDESASFYDDLIGSTFASNM